MPKDNLQLIQSLTQYHFSRLKVGALLTNLKKLIPISAELLKINISRYRGVPGVQSALGSSELALSCQTVSEIFLTFPLIVSSQLGSQPNYSFISQPLQIAGLGSLITQYSFQNSHLQCFLRNVNPGIDVYETFELHAALLEKTKYLPKLIHGDLHLIIKEIKWQPSEKLHVMIENLYCMSGLSQLFLRYYFDLLTVAKNDKIAQHIDDIFLNFFITLHFREEQYWESYLNPEKTRLQLLHVIESDDPARRHPVLRKQFFDQLNAFHPIIHHGEARKMGTKTKSLLQKQLEAFRSFSLKKMVLLLRVLTNIKDLDYSRYLLGQLAKTSPNKLMQLNKFLQSSEMSSFPTADILKIVQPVVQRLPQPKEIYYDRQMTRQKEAKEKREARTNAGGFTHDQLDGYLKNYFKKLHERVRKEGALTHDQVGDYLSRFFKRSVEFAQKKKISSQEKQEFEESLDSVLSELDGTLSKDEIDDYQEGIQETMVNFESSDPEERLHQIEIVGDILTEATEMADRKQEASKYEKMYQEALALQIPIDGTNSISVQRLLSSPVAQEEKLRLLSSHTPDLLTPEMYSIIERIQQRCQQNSSNPVSIYQTDGSLSQKQLLRLFFPKNAFKALLQQQVIPILPDRSKPNITVRDFFSFPFAGPKGPLEKSWFKQHLFYLRVVHNQGELPEQEYKTILENMEYFPQIEYKKYYNIVRKNKIEEITFLAVYNLWYNNGLQRLRVE